MKIMKAMLFFTILSLFSFVACESPVDPIDENPTDTTPVSDLSANQYKIGSTVFNVSTPGWQANGYSGFSDGIANQFKAIFSKKGPETGTYKVVSAASTMSSVAEGEIGVIVFQNYMVKPITANTGTAKVTHKNGVVTIVVNDVTMGADKFSAHYVIGNPNKYIYVDNNSLDPEYAKAKSEAWGSSVHMVKIETYGSQTSDSQKWGFVFYFGASTLADGSYTATVLPSGGLQSVESGKVYVIAENSQFQSFKSDATSGTVTVSKNKITFNAFKLKSGDLSITLRGEYQF
jgi:hypothetical protein